PRSTLFPYTTLFRSLEHVDEGVPDAAPLFLGILDARERREESLTRVHDAQVDPEVRPERALHLIPLVQAQQAVIDEDAREPLAQDRKSTRLNSSHVA